jgi:GDP-L-fucose synthase
MRPDPVFDLSGKKIWVAGETGMVGRATIKRLESENCTILSAPHSDLDLTHQNDTQDWLEENTPDVIIMVAAKVGGIVANMATPAQFLFENLAMAQNVIHGAFKTKVSKLLYLGSSCIYPRMAEQPIKEQALLTGELEKTNEAYAIAKIAGLKLCQFYKEQHGCDFISAMPTNLYGICDHFDAEKSHVIPAMILKMHEAKISGDAEVVLWGTGTPLREFLYVGDLADGLIHLLKYYNDSAPINIGSGTEISIHDLANKIKDVVGYQGNIVFDVDKPDGTPRKILDRSRIHQIGWHPYTFLEDGLQKTYEWFLENYQDFKPSYASSAA